MDQSPEQPVTPKVKITRKNVQVVPGSEETVDVRSIKRIDDTLDELRKVWMAYPDMRLTQLLWNVRDINHLSLQGTCTGFYNLEEDALLERVRARYGDFREKDEESDGD